MIIKKIAIYDKDTGYALNLAEYISKNKSREYTVFAFSEKDMFEEFISRGAPDLVLTDEDTSKWLSGSVDSWSLKNLFVLLEEKEISNEEKNGVFKYQAVEEIISQIERITNTQMEKEQEREEGNEGGVENHKEFQVKLVAVGTFFMESYNLVLAINRHHDNSLLVLDCNRISIFSESGNEKRLSMAIYLLESDLDKESELEECIEKRDDFSVIAGLNDLSDISMLTDKGLIKLKELVKKLGYKGIIIVCDSQGAIYLSRLVEKKDIVVLEGGSKKEKDFTYNLLKEIGCTQKKDINLINVDKLNEDFAVEDKGKGGLYKIIDELCR